MTVKIDPRFYAEVDEIFVFLAEKNLDSAIKYEQDIWNTIERLIDNPNIGVKYHKTYNQILCRKHYIFHSVDEKNKTLRIHHIRHTSKQELSQSIDFE